MFKKNIFSLAVLLVFSAADAAFTLKNGVLVDAEQVATMPLTKHYNSGVEAFEKRDWDEVIHHFGIVSNTAPDAPIGQESNFWVGVGHYHMRNYDFANDAFNRYLKAAPNPEYFEDAIEFKFQIAERFRKGAKRHPFGTKQLPKIAPAYDTAADIYEEVITAMPTGDTAARALYSKGMLLWSSQDFKGSIDAFQMLIKRFPKHELAPESYVQITRIYLDQAKHEFQNPDILTFAQLSLKKFRQDFPREEKVADGERNVMKIKELYASGLYETARFYERTEQPHASVIYYQNAITEFPDTRIAEKCRIRLKRLRPDLVTQMESASTGGDKCDS